MKCPVCEQKKLQSRVFAHGGSVTLIYCQPFYDSEGKYHVHDRNIRNEHYTCSQGHRWFTKSTAKCPSCDFGEDSMVVKIDKDTESELILNRYG